MMLSQQFFKFSVLLGFIIIVLVLAFGYLFFEPFLTEKTITIKVVNKEKFGNEPGKYFIFAEDEVFLNENNYYHDKDNADQLYQMIYRGSNFKVKVVGTYLPWWPRFRNIIKILEINNIPVQQEPVKLN